MFALAVSVNGMRVWLSTCCGLLISFTASLSANAGLVIYQFDVGMGDATLIVNTNSGRSSLTDAGGPGKGENVIVPALQSLGINQLNYIVISHYDADHIGGVDEIIDTGITVTEGVIDRGPSNYRKKNTPRVALVNMSNPPKRLGVIPYNLPVTL